MAENPYLSPSAPTGPTAPSGVSNVRKAIATLCWLAALGIAFGIALPTLSQISVANTARETNLSIMAIVGTLIFGIPTLGMVLLGVGVWRKSLRTQIWGGVMLAPLLIMILGTFAVMMM